MRILIDGYNLLHVSGILRRGLGPGSLERARNPLLNRLVTLLPPEEHVVGVGGVRSEPSLDCFGELSAEVVFGEAKCSSVVCAVFFWDADGVDASGSVSDSVDGSRDGGVKSSSYPNSLIHFATCCGSR